MKPSRALVVFGTGLVVLALVLRRAEMQPGPRTLPKVADSAGLRLETIITGLSSPVDLKSIPGDPRLFVVEPEGRIRVVLNGHVAPRAFLDITSRVGSGGERGLLSVAFHPDFAHNRRLFVYYTDRHGDICISEFTADATLAAADSTSERKILAIPHPTFPNHNGGDLVFGPDGALYAGVGDGGSGGDPHGHGQDERAALGKMYRIDFSRDYPRVSKWAMGVRNPWRFAFDSGLIYIADVGQGSWEEVDVAPASDSGLNYGWRTMEGAHCYLSPACSKQGLVLPAAEYDHGQGCSVIGGVVYRGHTIPFLAGHYLYSDYCDGGLRSFRYVNGAATQHVSWHIPRISGVTSFGEDSSHEVYMLTESGTVYRIAAN